MAIDNTLDGINAKLATAVGYVERIEKSVAKTGSASDRFRSAIASLSGGTAGVGGGKPNGGGASFSAQSNTGATNIMASSMANVPTPPRPGAPTTGGGGGAPNAPASPNAGGSSFGGGAGNPTSLMPSSFGKLPGMALAAGAFNAAWQGTPGVRDALAYQAALFPTAFSTAGPYSNRATSARIFGGIGMGASSTTDAQAAAALASNAGMTFNTGGLDRALNTAGFMFQMTGMNNVASMQGQVQMYRGGSGVASRLMRLGIATSDMQTGENKDLMRIVDQLWFRVFGNQKVTQAQFDNSLLKGWLGATLNKLFGDQPDLYQQIVTLMRVKAKAGGRSGMSTNPAAGANYIGTVAQSLGMTEYNSPSMAAGRINSGRSRNIEASSESLVNSYVNSTDALVKMNDAMVALTEATGPLAGAFYNLKGFLDNFVSSSEGGALAGFLTGAASGAMALGGSAGTSTSDSIRARLSKGEYVINARAAQKIGRKNLDLINSMGHSFGSAFASPAKQFDKGGSTVSGNPALTPGSEDLTTVNVAGGRSITVAREAAPIFAQLLSMWQSDPDLGGGRFDLSKGLLGSYAYRKARAANQTSDHAGWAIDVRYDVLKADNNRHMTDAEQSAVRRILENFGGRIGWGGEYENLIDEMHFYYKGGAGSSGYSAPTIDKSFGSDSVATDPVMDLTGSYSGPVGGNLLGGISGNVFDPNAASAAMSGRSLLGRAGARSLRRGDSGLGKAAPTVTGPTSGRGGDQLIQWLRAAGFEGSSLATAWAVAMRESGGRPNAHNTNAATGDNSYGLFQINMLGSLGPARRAKFLKYVPGFKTDEDLLNPEINARAAYYMTGGGRNWASWDIDASGYAGGANAAKYRKWLKKYPGDGTKTSMSHGSEYVSQDMTANLHAGELVMPAAQATQFRQALSEVLSGQRGSRDVTINLKIDRASDEEAVKFAKKVKQLLEDDRRLERLRTR